MLEHADIVTLLDALELALPDMIARHKDEADFWSEFAAEADEIVERAGQGGGRLRARASRLHVEERRANSRRGRGRGLQVARTHRTMDAKSISALHLRQYSA